MRKYNSLIILLLLLTGCTQRKEYDLPDDLLYKGQPIHPCQVLATQFGDRTRFEPRSVECVEDGYNHHLDYSSPCFRETTIPKHHAEDAYWSELENNYMYVGSYKNNHIILGYSHDTGTTGCFSFLTLLKREGDTIANVGEIASGDRGHGGIIDIISLDNNLLRYIQSATIGFIMKQLTNAPTEIHFPYFLSGVYLTYEVNLDGPMEYMTYPSQIIGLLFDQDSYEVSDHPDYLYDETFQLEHSFYTIANKFIQNGKRELNLKEAKIFAAEVTHYMQNKIWNYK